MNAPLSSADTLRTALAALLDGLPPKSATQAVDRLIANYRGRTPTDAPVLRDRSDVVAYAAYRMPATFEAVCSALDAFAAAVPGWAPGSHVDVGGGTGAATWAVSATWEGGRPVTVLDWAEPALALGREIAAANPELKAAEWRRSRIGSALTVESTDLVTISYVLGELTAADRTAVVDAAATAAQAVVIIEPGTPDGYTRVIEARDRLLAAGFHIAAPCPHSAACPIVPGEDWCHFSARVSRSSLHRQVKGGSLPYEDEKFSYVAATRFPPAPAPSRIVRKPQIRKGQVLLDLCETKPATDSETEATETEATETEATKTEATKTEAAEAEAAEAAEARAVPALSRTTVTKRHGLLYKAARDAEWGDAWPPVADGDEGTD